MREQDKRLLAGAIDVLNRHGQEAASYLLELLTRPENDEAEAWIAGLWEPHFIKERLH